MRITFTKEILQKLRLKVGDFKINSDIRFDAIGRVVGLTQREKLDYESSSVEIQITGLHLKSAKKGLFQQYKEQRDQGPTE